MKPVVHVIVMPIEVERSRRATARASDDYSTGSVSNRRWFGRGWSWRIGGMIPAPKSVTGYTAPPDWRLGVSGVTARCSWWNVRASR